MTPRVLVVEDESGYQSLLQGVFASADFATTIAGSAAQAIDFLRESGVVFHLLSVDLDLRMGDGPAPAWNVFDVLNEAMSVVCPPKALIIVTGAPYREDFEGYLKSVGMVDEHVLYARVIERMPTGMIFKPRDQGDNDRFVRELYKTLRDGRVATALDSRARMDVPPYTFRKVHLGWQIRFGPETEYIFAPDSVNLASVERLLFSDVPIDCSKLFEVVADARDAHSVVHQSQLDPPSTVGGKSVDRQVRRRATKSLIEDRVDFLNTASQAFGEYDKLRQRLSAAWAPSAKGNTRNSDDDGSQSIEELEELIENNRNALAAFCSGYGVQASGLFEMTPEARANEINKRYGRTKVEAADADRARVAVHRRITRSWESDLGPEHFGSDTAALVEHLKKSFVTGRLCQYIGGVKWNH